jgi:hypothetical protein
VTKLSPLCLYNKTGRALVNSGWILPCCFIDYDFRYYLDTLPEEFQNLVDEELKLSNVESVDALFESKQWKAFLKYMKDAHEGKITCNVKTCNEFCTKNFDQDPTAKRERI